MLGMSNGPRRSSAVPSGCAQRCGKPISVEYEAIRKKGKKACPTPDEHSSAESPSSGKCMGATAFVTLQATFFDVHFPPKPDNPSTSRRREQTNGIRSWA
jgi:hypothetical protein